MNYYEFKEFIKTNKDPKYWYHIHKFAKEILQESVTLKDKEIASNLQMTPQRFAMIKPLLMEVYNDSTRH